MSPFASRDLLVSLVPDEAGRGTDECATQCTCCTNKSKKLEPGAGDGDYALLEEQLLAALN